VDLLHVEVPGAVRHVCRLYADRHNPPLIFTVAIGVVIGTWLERYTWISGSVEPQYYHMPMTGRV